MNQTNMNWMRLARPCSAEGMRQDQSFAMRNVPNVDHPVMRQLGVFRTAVLLIDTPATMEPENQRQLYSAVSGARCVGYASSDIKSGEAIIA
jgi:hypothetical protein